MKKDNPNQMSLFEVISSTNENHSDDTDQISVMKMKFISQELSTYEELFKGYNEIRVITYSYALSFIEEIMHYFDRGEVIIGFDKLVNPTMAELFAVQEYATNYVCRNKYLQKRINDDEFRFYVVNDLISHQKIYLLKADNGRVRTITGSANFSGRAWNGEQIENIIVCDDQDCYDTYMHQYETLQQFSSDKISKEAKEIAEDKDHISELPIFKRIEKENGIVLHDTKSREDVEYMFHTEKLSKEWEERLSTANLKVSKDGDILFDFKKMKNIVDAIKKDNQKKKERELVNPQFILDYKNYSATFNQKPFNLNPNKEAIINDIQYLLEYMDGFSLFTKDTVQLKISYWKILNYMFLSPFIGKLYYEAKYNGYGARFFPMYLLIHGDSDAGKTAFINFSRKLMFNEELNTLTQNYFSSKPMTYLKTNVKGCPILIDELTSTYWKYAKDITKIDENMVGEDLINRPTFILLSNDISSVPAEINKRIIVMNLDNRLDRTTAAYNGKKINNIRKNVDNALYCEYLRRMFAAIDEFLIELQQHDENDEWIPDVFKMSSKIIIDIMHDFHVTIPPELSIFTWADYMGETTIAEKAINIIRDEYAHNSNIFYVNSTKNELEIDFSCYDSKEAKKKLDALYGELPAKVECNIVGSKAILKLDVIKKYSGINFKKKHFWSK